MRGLIACATAACALLIALPGAALAANATWSSTGPVQLSATGPFTVQLGTENYTCPATDPYTTWGTSSLVNNSAGGVSSWSGLDYQSFNCTRASGGSVLIQFAPYSQILATKTGSVFSLSGSKAMLVSGGPAFNTPAQTPPASYTASWINGTSAANPSRAVFVNAPVSQNAYGVVIKLSGTFLIRTFAGGLLTLS